jgi:hypothetical protein
MSVPVVYRSTDSGAPVITTALGAMVTLLDACLVNGYGSKPAAGWAKSFTGTNGAVYRAPAGNRHYVSVDAKYTSYSEQKGWITATDFLVGTGVFGVAYWRHSSTWVLVADDKSLIYIAAPLGSPTMGLWGDIFSLLPGDAYATLLVGTSGFESNTNQQPAPPSGGSWYLARAVSQAGSGVGCMGGGYSSSGAAVGGGSLVSWMNPAWPWPNPADSGMHLSRMSISNSTDGLRGFVRGVWLVPHAWSNWSGSLISDLPEFDGNGDFAGRSFIIVQSTSTAVLAIETTDWDN